MVKAYIQRDGKAVRIFCQRERRKWWRELGQHRATDREFERALAAGEVAWNPKIKDEAKIFD